MTSLWAESSRGYSHRPADITYEGICLKFDAQVIAAYGRHLLVRDAEGSRHEARPFGRKLLAVCGDRVRCERDAQHEETHVVEILPRDHVLLRANLKGGAEPIVANLTQLLTLLAPEPRPDPFIIDRYLCAASSAGLRAIVVLNKADQMNDASRVSLSALLSVYQAAGYDTLVCSATTGEGLKELAEKLTGEISVLVGQSGVGKSSVVAQLTAQESIAVGALDRDAEGRHTTTASQLYDLPAGGALIDSPGVRDFAPAIDALEPRSLGFPEIDQASVHCRFIDCQHLKEPHCGVRAALEEGRIDERRYESYRRLRRLFVDLTAARGPTGRSRS